MLLTEQLLFFHKSYIGLGEVMILVVFFYIDFLSTKLYLWSSSAFVSTFFETLCFLLRISKFPTKVLAFLFFRLDLMILWSDIMISTFERDGPPWITNYGELCLTVIQPTFFLLSLILDESRCIGASIYHGLCNLFFGVLHGMLFYCFISDRLYIFELFSFIFIRVLPPFLRPQN